MTDRQKPKRPTMPPQPERDTLDAEDWWDIAQDMDDYADEVDAYYRDLLRRAVEALAKMHGVNRHLIGRCDMCSLIAEIREHLGEDA